MTQRETDQVASISGEKRVKLPLTLIWSGIGFVAGAASLGTICYMDLQALKKGYADQGHTLEVVTTQLADIRDEVRELRWTITPPGSRPIVTNKTLTGATP